VRNALRRHYGHHSIREDISFAEEYLHEHAEVVGAGVGGGLGAVVSGGAGSAAGAAIGAMVGGALGVHLKRRRRRA
jgi:outer membrane lipoprotein SlyB